MKKLIVFIFIIVLLCCMNLSAIENLTLDKIFPNASVEVYLENKTEIDLPKVSNGSGEIIFCSVEEIGYILKTEKIAGITLKIDAMPINSVLEMLNANNVVSENFGVYGYSNMFEGWAKLNKVTDKNIKISEKICNFQCFSLNNSILIGFPILLGSY